jgi:hypothetical protein
MGENELLVITIASMKKGKCFFGEKKKKLKHSTSDTRKRVLLSLSYKVLESFHLLNLCLLFVGPIGNEILNI